MNMRTFKMTNKRCVTKKVKMCICTICFCMCVVYFVFWYVKHRLKKKKKKKKNSDLPTLFFFSMLRQSNNFFFMPYMIPIVWMSHTLLPMTPVTYYLFTYNWISLHLSPMTPNNEPTHFTSDPMTNHPFTYNPNDKSTTLTPMTSITIILTPKIQMTDQYTHTNNQWFATF